MKQVMADDDKGTLAINSFRDFTDSFAWYQL